MPYRYVPLLRSKAGEALALENLATQAKRRVLPVIHITGSAPPVTFGTRVSAAWTGLPIALDGLYNFGIANSAQTFTHLFTELARGGAAIIPSVEYNSPAAYIAVVQRLLNRYGRGAVVKCSLRHVGRVATWVTAQGWQTTDIDLLVPGMWGTTTRALLKVMWFIQSPTVFRILLNGDRLR
jgi:Beta protein